jgi:hypothetical protein
MVRRQKPWMLAFCKHDGGEVGRANNYRHARRSRVSTPYWITMVHRQKSWMLAFGKHDG